MAQQSAENTAGNIEALSFEAALAELTSASAQASAERQQLERRVAESRQRADRLAAQAAEAQQAAYQIVEKIHWPDAYYRTDIGYRAVAREHADN